jgi:ABC-type multidrug transport system ATPase subunit
MASNATTGAPVVLSGIGKRFGRRGAWVLDRVDCELASGCITVVQGGNASGKTTLLRIVAGVALPTVGRVTRSEAPVAFVPERLPTRIRMTAAEYCTHLGRVRGLDDSVVRTRSAAWFDRLGLAPGPDVRVGSLSKGNVQKVALAQALLGESGLLVLDEPYNGLDVSAHEALASLLAEARDLGAAVVVTAHDAYEIPGADRVLQLRDGTLVDGLRAADPSPVVSVELRATSDRAVEGDLVARPGVHVVERDSAGRHLVMHVTTAEVDALLVHALTSGWSVLRVTPDATSGAERHLSG